MNSFKETRIRLFPTEKFKGSSYKDDEAESQSLYILYDETNDHFTAIVSMQAFCRSVLTHRDELFCDKCLGWISKWKLFTHLCIYNFRCFHCGFHGIENFEELRRHRSKIVQGTETCKKCGKDMAGIYCILAHQSWCQKKKLDWITCYECSQKILAKWNHRCYHSWCKMCKKHYTINTDHRCFISKDPFRRSTEKISFLKRMKKKEKN